MTISEAMHLLLQRKLRRKERDFMNRPHINALMRVYMVAYRRTPKGKRVVRKANRNYFRKNELAIRMYNTLCFFADQGK